MKKWITWFPTTMIIVACAAVACAEKSPVVLTHTLTGYSEGPNATLLEYTLQVRNTGDLALANISLSLIPRPPLMMRVIHIPIGNLAPGGTAEVKVKSSSRELPDKGYFSRTPLSFAGKCTDPKGKVMEFPVQSDPGGAQ